MSQEYPQYIEEYPLEKLKLNDWNPNKMDGGTLKSLVHSIQQRKFIVPIVISSEGLIIDGEHRYLASKECGLEKVPVIVVEMSTDEMKLGTLGLNGIRGENIPLQMAKLLHDLHQRYSLEEIAESIGYKQEDVKDKLQLLEIPENLLQKLKVEAGIRETQLHSVLNFVMSQEQEKYVLEALEEVEGNNRTEKLLSLCKAYLKEKNQIAEKT
jgi:ParB/RepB/Spo0J family partition protein